MAAPSQESQQPEPKGIKPAPRSGHVAVADGDIMFVWGGFSEYVDPWVPHERYQLGADVWIYNALVNKWYKKKTSGETPPGTSGATAVIIDSDLFIIGGHTAAGNTNFVYRLNLHKWEWCRADLQGECHTRKMSPRDKFTSWHYKTRLYVFGGFGISTADFLSNHGDFYVDTSTWQPLRGWNNQVLIFDPQLCTWSNPAIHGPAPLPRAAHSAVQFDNKVFVFGGRHHQMRLNDMHCLDMDNLRWSGEIQVPGELPLGRSWHSLSKVSQTHALLYGGYTQEGFPLSDGWLFDTVVSQWTQMVLPDNRPRLWHTGVSTSDGDVVVFGGCTNDILSEESSNHTNELIILQSCVKSLLRLCLDTAYDHHHILQSEWSSLPKPLYHILELRLQGLNDSDEASLGLNTKTCTIS